MDTGIVLMLLVLIYLNPNNATYILIVILNIKIE